MDKRLLFAAALAASSCSHHQDKGQEQKGPTEEQRAEAAAAKDQLRQTWRDLSGEALDRHYLITFQPHLSQAAYVKATNAVKTVTESIKARFASLTPLVMADDMRRKYAVAGELSLVSTELMEIWMANWEKAEPYADRYQAAHQEFASCLDGAADHAAMKACHRALKEKLLED